jgi:DNA (cytosine-5)-methyltransferase 1
LFSGVGGIELGLERAGGFKTAWFVEYEPYAQAVLRKRFPSTPVYGDITQLDFSSLPRVDVLTGGFPCQDISNAGRRVGIEGSRSSLWKYYAEAIRCLRPRLAFIENVSALTRRGLDVVLGDLASIGYDAEWHCFPASAVGAPHQRDRIAIIAYPNDGRRPENEVCSRGNSSSCSDRSLAYSDDGGCVHGQVAKCSTEGGEQTLSLLELQ